MYYSDLAFQCFYPSPGRFLLVFTAQSLECPGGLLGIGTGGSTIRGSPSTDYAEGQVCLAYSRQSPESRGRC